MTGVTAAYIRHSGRGARRPPVGHLVKDGADNRAAADAACRWRISRSQAGWVSSMLSAVMRFTMRLSIGCSKNDLT
jgi:hypothetical protein